MSPLKQLIASHGIRDVRSTGAMNDRRDSQDRRVSERRHNLYPFESREARLRFAAQAAGFGTYDLDCITGDSLWSPELRTMAGLPDDRAPLPADQVEALIHPEDRQRFLDKLQASLAPEGGGEFDDEHRLLRPDGSVLWVRTKGRTFFIGEGDGRRALAATGIVMDITASRRAEREQEEGRLELKTLVEAAIDAIVTIDGDQRIIRFNPSAVRMFGCPEEEAIGTHVERFIPERYRAGHPDKVRRFAEGDLPAKALDRPAQYIGLRANGEEFPFEGTVTKVAVGSQIRMTTFMRDINDRVRAEEALRHSKEDLELAVRGANIGIWHWDQRNGGVEWSERIYQLLGIPHQEEAGFERSLAAIHPDDRDKVLAALHRTLETGAEYAVEFRAVWPDGSIHWIAAIGRDLSGESDGRMSGIRGIALDISERKRQEEALQSRADELERRVEERTAELREAKEILERSNLELQQFAFIAAHDLQTPLRSISGFAQLLRRDYQGQLDAQADAWLDQLGRSAQRMRDIINDILAYSRVESRGSAFEPTDFNRLFDDVAAALDAPIRETGAVVTRDTLPTVAVDRTQLGQVLQNLIDNAIKYHGPRPPEVHVRASRQGNDWVFAVRDRGIGIAEKHQEKIFDIFQRLHTQQEYPGTGIGLAICRRVIHRHGGRIWVESEAGEGSTFYFSLPAGAEG